MRDDFKCCFDPADDQPVKGICKPGVVIACVVIAMLGLPTFRTVPEARV